MDTKQQHAAEHLKAVGFFCEHPTQPARLIRNIENADKYANQYLRGVVTIEPVVLKRNAETISQQRDKLLAVMQKIARGEYVEGEEVSIAIAAIAEIEASK